MGWGAWCHIEWEWAEGGASELLNYCMNGLSRNWFGSDFFSLVWCGMAGMVKTCKGYR